MYRSWYRYRYRIDIVTEHLGRIGTKTSTRYRTFRYVFYDINPIPSRCDIIRWSYGSRQRPKPRTHTPVLKHLPALRSANRDTEHARPRSHSRRMTWPPSVMPPLAVAGNLRQLPCQRRCQRLSMWTREKSP